MKNTSYTIGESTIAFSAPHIQKNFWFGEDARTVEEWNEVQDFVASCENEKYFMSENMRNTDAARYLRMMDDRRFRLWFVSSTWGGETHVSISAGYYTDMTYDRYFVRELTDEEREQLRTACETEQAKFEKRLRTYLKRYGLSKCYFSTYWSNR